MLVHETLCVDFVAGQWPLNDFDIDAASDLIDLERLLLSKVLFCCFKRLAWSSNGHACFLW
jgi:hypothetical protein